MECICPTVCRYVSICCHLSHLRPSQPPTQPADLLSQHCSSELTGPTYSCVEEHWACILHSLCGTTAQLGPRISHCLGLYITHTRRTPQNERSATCTTYNKHDSEIRTQNPSNQVVVDLRLRPHGSRSQHTTHSDCNRLCACFSLQIGGGRRDLGGIRVNLINLCACIWDIYVPISEIFICLYLWHLRAYVSDIYVLIFEIFMPGSETFMCLYLDIYVPVSETFMCLYLRYLCVCIWYISGIWATWLKFFGYFWILNFVLNLI
jgi:hypothetical protein